MTLYAQWSATGYEVTYSAGANATVSRSSDSYAIGGTALTLPTPTRTNFVFNGWYDAATGGSLVGAAGASYTPSSSRTIYGRWTQSSLYGISSSLTSLGTLTASAVSNGQISATVGASSVSLTLPAAALPTGTTLTAQLVGDFTRAQALIGSGNNFILSLVVSWLASDETVPNTASGTPITMTITNPAIKAGASVYSVLDGSSTLLARATQDGTVTVNIESDPEVVVLATVPEAPTSVSATSGADSQSAITWSAPTINGGSEIIGYTATSSGGQTCTTTGDLTCTISGLTNGTAYTFTVIATNAIGNSSSSTASSAATPAAPVTSSNSSSGSSSSTNASSGSSSSSSSNKPVVPAVPEVTTPAAPVTSTADGTTITDNYTSAKTLLDGVVKEEKLTVIDTTKVVTEALGIKLELQILNQAFKPVPVTNEVKLTLEHTGIAQFSGNGFKPTTNVKVWLFSDPIYLGEYPVDASGKFNASFLVLDNLPVGDHLLQINGVTVDSKVFSQSIPVVVKAVDAVIPVKPEDPTKPVDPNTPVVPKPTTVTKPTLTFYFAGNSTKVDSSIVKYIKKYASKVKGAKSITCVAYKSNPKSSSKLLNTRALNACKYLKQRFGGAVKVLVKPISQAPTKGSVGFKARSGRVDIFVTK